MRNSFLLLFGPLILRALVRQKVRTAVAILGMALGVATMLAVRMANTSVTASFRSAVESLSGDVSLSILGSAGAFDERLAAELGWLTDFGTVSPVLETVVLLPDPSRENHHPGIGQLPGELVRVLGVDVLRDSSIRRYRLLRTSRAARDPTVQELLALLNKPDSVILTERLARRRGLRVGDPVTLVFGSARQRLRVRGLLLDEGPARALDGHFALMDIAAMQWAADRLGTLDRIDIELPQGRDPDAALQAIAARLPAGLRVERPDARYGRTETMIAAFHFNLNALSAIALVVGLFLIYNTISISVAARREEIGMLQALGAGRRFVLALFLGEAVLIAGAGTIPGLFLGQWLAQSAVEATAGTVETFYIAEVAQQSARATALELDDVFLALGLAVPLALVAAIVPAREAARIEPVEVIRGSEQLARSARPPTGQLVAAVGLGALGGLLTRLPPVAGRPVFGFLAELAFMLAGAMLVPQMLWLACALVRRLAADRLPAWREETRLAAANLQGAIPRVSISVAALAVSLAMMVAISVMVGSFRQTVVVWLDATLNADVFVRPMMLTSSVSEVHLDGEVARRVQRDPDVLAVTGYRTWQIAYADRAVRLSVTRLADALRYQRVAFKEPLASPDAWRGDAAVVSESFSLLFGKHVGDEFPLPTPHGRRTFRVAGVYYDYASNQGTVLLDEGVFRRYFAGGKAPEPSALSVYLKKGADPETVRQRLLAALRPDYDVFVETNRTVRREAMRIFDSTFTITDALQVIAIAIAGMGVIATLITLIYERQREIALLSLVGATQRQVRRMVLVEAVLLGAVSQAVGILVGLLLATVLIQVINVQSFGWTIQFHLPVAFLIQTTLGILAATALSGLVPAWRAARIEAMRAVRET